MVFGLIDDIDDVLEALGSFQECIESQEQGPEFPIVLALLAVLHTRVHHTGLVFDFLQQRFYTPQSHNGRFVGILVEEDVQHF